MPEVGCADLTGGYHSRSGTSSDETRQLGYLKVTVDPAHNTATAQEIFVAHVNEDDDDETPIVYDPPVIAGYDNIPP